MPTSPMKRVVKHLRRAALLQDGAGQTDGQLLVWFIERRDEVAFEALVRRHGPMVMSVCRRLLRNYHDAEDAFQATFLVLVRKAASIVPPEKVANWLHGVAYHTALKAKAISAKRSLRERQVPALPDPEEVQRGDFWQQLLPLLDRELSRLPDKYRVPIILCDLEGRSIKETARHLGWPQGTVAGRLARGRKLLAKRLAQRGVMLSAGALAAALSENAASACVPTFLVSSTVKAATLLAAGQAAIPGLISVQAAALTEGVVVSMLLNKLKTVTMLLVVLGMVAFGGGWVVTHATAKAQQGQTEKADAKSPISPMPAASKIPAETKGKVTVFEMKMKLVEVDADGKSRTLMAPHISALEDCVAQVHIGCDAALGHPNIANACSHMKLGPRFEIKVKRVDVGKAQIDLSYSTCKVEKAEKIDTVIVANSVRAVKQVELDERYTIVLSQDQQGKPQLWFELTVSEAEVQHVPNPLHSVDKPAAGTRATPKEWNPEDPGASWPFIN